MLSYETHSPKFISGLLWVLFICQNETFVQNWDALFLEGIVVLVTAVVKVKELNPFLKIKIIHTLQVSPLLES
jgi:hypothetical protein